jgi:F0F1-type ATP synthase gamma subunit
MYVRTYVCTVCMNGHCAFIAGKVRHAALLPLKDSSKENGEPPHWDAIYNSKGIIITSHLLSKYLSMNVCVHVYVYVYLCVYIYVCMYA